MKFFLTSSPALNESICHQDVTFICIGIQIPTGLQWILNGRFQGRYYVGGPTDISLYPPTPGVRARVTNVTVITEKYSYVIRMNITSTYSGSSSFFEGKSVMCKSNFGLTSNILMVTILGKSTRDT